MRRTESLDGRTTWGRLKRPNRRQELIFGSGENDVRSAQVTLSVYVVTIRQRHKRRCIYHDVTHSVSRLKGKLQDGPLVNIRDSSLETTQNDGANAGADTILHILSIGRVGVSIPINDGLGQVTRAKHDVTASGSGLRVMRILILSALRHARHVTKQAFCRGSRQGSQVQTASGRIFRPLSDAGSGYHS